MHVWQTPVRQLQRVRTSQASASSSTLRARAGNRVEMPLRAKVTSGPVPAGPGGWCGGRTVWPVRPGLIDGSASELPVDGVVRDLHPVDPVLRWLSACARSFGRDLGVRSAVPTPVIPAGIQVRLSTEEELGAWIAVVTDDAVHPDTQGLPWHDKRPWKPIENAECDLAVAGGTVTSPCATAWSQVG